MHGRCNQIARDVTGKPAHRLLVRVLSPGTAAHRARETLRDVLTAAGVRESDVFDAELAVGELAANADLHARRPYEMRILLTDGRPMWCEVVDSDPDLGNIPAILGRLQRNAFSESYSNDGPLHEGGYGLLMVYRLSGGRCWTFPTIVCTTGDVGKAVAFALPAGGWGK